MSDPAVEYVRSPNGTRIAYRRLGNGPAIVALHGGLGTWRSWQPVARQLADRYELFLVDRRGRGDSDDGSGPYTIAQEVSDTRAVLAAAGPGAALLGHSYGGAVALEAARIARPGEIGALMVYEPAVRVAALIPADRLDALHARVAAGAPEQAVSLSMQLLDDAGLVTADGPLSTLRIKPTAAFRRLAATVPREIGAAVALGDDLDRYATIDVPTLLLIGTASPAPAQANVRALATALTNVTVAPLAGLAHTAHTAAPNTVADAVTTFLTA